MTQQPSAEAGRRRWLVPVLSTVAVALVAGGVTAWLTGGTADRPSASHSTRVKVFYVGGSPERAWLYPETHDVVGGGGQLQLAVNEALGTPLDPDYRPGFPEGTSATVSIAGSTATVDLRGSAVEATPEKSGTYDGALALQSLVHTVAANTDRQVDVEFTVAGEAPVVLLGEKLDGPVPAAKETTVLSPVRLDLEEGALLRPRAEVTGTAAAFEGTVVWQVSSKAGGAPIEEGHTTTEECCRPMPFSIALPTLPAGTYVLQVAETDPSGGEGFPPAKDTKTFTLG